MTIKKFEEIISWQKAQDLAEEIYTAFEKSGDLDLRCQIKSAAVSISNNIAEGFERGSDADFVRMLYIAKGSAGEVRSMVYLAVRLKFLPAERKEHFLSQCNDISRLITALIKSVGTKGRGRGIPLSKAPISQTND